LCIHPLWFWQQKLEVVVLQISLDTVYWVHNSVGPVERGNLGC
jgi:hypothetical protein